MYKTSASKSASVANFEITLLFGNTDTNDYITNFRHFVNSSN